MHPYSNSKNDTDSIISAVNKIELKKVTVNKVVIPDRILIPFVVDIHEAYGHIGLYKTFKIMNESC